MALHTLEPERKTLHGHFSRDLPPVLTIDSGDTVRFRTLDASWTTDSHVTHGMKPTRLEGRVKGKDDGHALCGPVEIRGAKAGMTLEVGIDDIRVGSWGWAGGWSGNRSRKLNIAEGEKCELHWELDGDAGEGVSNEGHRVALRPFMGVMGMPPAESGDFGTGPPRACGGNLDCKELVAGTTLYLPIAVDGALFSTGDGHAVQGDGEVSGVAIECPMDRVDLTLSLRDDIQVSAPRARVAGGWITMGLHEDLNEATPMALSGMLDLMVEQFDMTRTEALAIASLVVDMRITQIVNGTCGVHAFLPDGAVR